VASYEPNTETLQYCYKLNQLNYATLAREAADIAQGASPHGPNLIKALRSIQLAFLTSMHQPPTHRPSSL
jgi:hypothetical protein